MKWSVIGLMILHSFHIIWVVFFLLDSNEFIISGAVANWYYEDDKNTPQI